MSNDRVADAGMGVSFGVPAGITIAQINDWLQAAAFIVAIISGICAARYYSRKSKD